MQPEQQELNGLQILAVDDEESNLLLLRRILERAA
jgi:CheY-like chemotaxis protein